MLVLEAVRLAVCRLELPGERGQQPAGGIDRRRRLEPDRWRAGAPYLDERVVLTNTRPVQSCASPSSERVK